MKPTQASPGKAPTGRTAGRKAIIIEDQRLFAEFLAHHCRELGLKILLQASTYAEGIAAVRRLQPELVLLDIGLPDGDGLELAKSVIEGLPAVKILAVSGRCDPWTMLRVQRHGLHGFVDKNDQRPEVLSEAIQAVFAGRVSYSPVVIESSASLRRDPNAFIRVLTDYETRILSMIGESMTDAEIGRVLGVSPSTVQSRRRDIMHKLNIRSTPKLIHYALVHGLTRTELLKPEPTNRTSNR